MNDQEKRARDELSTIRETTDATLKQLEGQAQYTKEMDLQSYSEREVFLTSEVWARTAHRAGISTRSCLKGSEGKRPPQVAKLRAELGRVRKE